MSVLSKNFSIFKNQRFSMKLSNGYGIEVRFGPTDMCGNFSPTRTTDFPASYFTYDSDDCEVIITKNLKDITQEFLSIHMDGMDKANLTPDDIAHIISIIAILPEE